MAAPDTAIQGVLAVAAAVRQHSTFPVAPLLLLQVAAGVQLAGLFLSLVEMRAHLEGLAPMGGSFFTETVAVAEAVQQMLAAQRASSVQASRIGGLGAFLRRLPRTLQQAASTHPPQLVGLAGPAAGLREALSLGA